MLNVNVFVNDFTVIKNNLLKRKNIEESQLTKLRDNIVDLKQKRELLENEKALLNKKNRELGIAVSSGKDISEHKKSLSKSKENLTVLSDEVKNLKDSIDKMLYIIPNIISDDTKYGENEDDNIVIKNVLEPRKFNFPIKSHIELADNNGWIDFTKGVKISKSRFSVFALNGAKLERALVNYMLDFNSKESYNEYSLPQIVNSNSLIGTSQLPKFKDDLFKIEDEDLYLVPTSEVSLTNLYKDTIIDIKELPIKLTSFSQCFRKEAGSGGKDVSGIMRQHQFGKVEIVQITKQEDSDNAFNNMVEHVSKLLSSLGLPHRLVSLCSCDIGFSANKTIDLEVWVPSQNRYREISSVSNTLDFQSRRAMIRYKDDGKNLYAHTLNGSSLAVGRTLLAIMENFQNEDNSISIPNVLQKYL